MVKGVARQVTVIAAIVLESGTRFYFLQRLQQIFSALHRNTPLAIYLATALRDKLHEKLGHVTQGNFFL